MARKLLLSREEQLLAAAQAELAAARQAETSALEVRQACALRGDRAGAAAAWRAATATATCVKQALAKVRGLESAAFARRQRRLRPASNGRDAACQSDLAKRRTQEALASLGYAA